MRLNPKSRLGVLALCLLLTGCGLKAPLFLREPAVNFPPMATTRLTPASATRVAPSPATLTPPVGTASAPATVTREAVPSAVTHGPTPPGRP